jgi:hypothetical protein
MKRLPVTGFCVLLLLFLGAGFVSSEPALTAVESQGAENQVLDEHVGYYREHLASLLEGGANCR